MSEAFSGLNKQFHKELEEEIKALDKTILNGNLSAYDEYKRLVGKRNGLMYALERHKELITLLEQR
jgi:hypothetical protein